MVGFILLWLYWLYSQGWKQGRAPGRPSRPLGPLVKVYQESVTLMQNLKKAESSKKETNESETV
jgi:hypothetical protein